MSSGLNNINKRKRPSTTQPNDPSKRSKENETVNKDQNNDGCDYDLTGLDQEIANLILTNKLNQYSEVKDSKKEAPKTNQLLIQLNSNEEGNKLITWLSSKEFLKKTPTITRAQLLSKLFIVKIEFTDTDKEQMIRQQITNLNIPGLIYVSEIPEINYKLNYYVAKIFDDRFQPVKLEKRNVRKELEKELREINNLNDKDLVVERVYPSHPSVAKIGLDKEKSDKDLWLGLRGIELHKYFPIPTCSNCSQLDHTVDKCEINVPICPSCAGCHARSTCKSKKKECINCIVRFESREIAKHPSTFMACPTRLDLMEHFAEGGKLNVPEDSST